MIVKTDGSFAGVRLALAWPRLGTILSFILPLPPATAWNYDRACNELRAVVLSEAETWRGVDHEYTISRDIIARFQVRVSCFLSCSLKIAHHLSLLSIGTIYHQNLPRARKGTDRSLCCGRREDRICLVSGSEYFDWRQQSRGQYPARTL